MTRCAPETLAYLKIGRRRIITRQQLEAFLTQAS
jgi:hypothetical protein